MKRLLTIFSIILSILIVSAQVSYSQCNPWYELSDPALGWENRFGDEVNFAGDVNNDGYDDILVGAERRTRSLYLFSGVDGSLIHKFTDYNSRSKNQITAPFGDYNSDGHDDFVYNSTTSVKLISGKDMSVLLEIMPPEDAVYFGSSVDAGLDVNNDGTNDIIVGASGSHGGYGHAYVYSGADGSLLYDYRLYLSSTQAQYGRSVILVGDMNGDGFAEFAVGAPYEMNNNVGAIYLYSGLDGSLIMRKLGAASQEMLGWDLSRLGDVNGDDLSDFIVGVGDQYRSTYASDTKRAFVIESTPSLETWLVIRILNGSSRGFGSTVGYVGDINHDGFDDIGIGTYLCCSNRGAVYIYSGADPTYNTIITSFQGQAGDLRWLGFDIKGGGDVNGDGNPDLLVGSPRDLGYRGSVQVFTCIYQDSTCLAADDTDGDGRGDPCDNCPEISNTNQNDADHDGIGDVCDECTDTDGDGYGNPGFPANTCPEDNCPDIFTLTQIDTDGDGIGDICDNCSGVSNSDQRDSDDDGLGNACDNCPTKSNGNQTDGDNDGFGDVCDNCIIIANADQVNSDSDNFGDACDNCPDLANSNQWDSDNDGLGNDCDNCTDPDGDGIGMLTTYTGPDACPTPDNCGSIANPDQADRDLDNIGDACDNCPDDANANQHDWNYDGIGDSCANITTFENGDSVVVEPGFGVTITFERIYYQGVMEVNLVDSVEADPPPSNFSVLPGDGGQIVYYNIDVPQGYTNGIHEICIQYDDTGMDEATELEVSLWHWGYPIYTGGGGEGDSPSDGDVKSWINATTSIDTVNNIVCGETDNFSPFLVGVAGIVTAVDEYSTNLPFSFSLSQNYPNPFNPVTEISFNLPEVSDVMLEVFNVTGQRLAVLVEGRVRPGKHTVSWDASDRASGIYLYRLTANDFAATKKMLLIK